jgi:hypothetical protein
LRSLNICRRNSQDFPCNSPVSFKHSGTKFLEPENRMDLVSTMTCEKQSTTSCTTCKVKTNDAKDWCNRSQHKKRGWRKFSIPQGI